MIIAVIGAQGRTGKAFVKAALAAGHTVRAGFRGERTLTEHPHLIPIQCESTNPTQVETLLKGSDALVSLIGHVSGSPADVQTRSISIVLSVMKKLGMKRVISLTGTGVRFPDDNISLIDRFLNFGVAFVDPNRIKDGIHHVELLKNSSTDWTVIRVLKLENTPEKPFILTPGGPGKIIVSREEAAAATLQVLTEQSFIQQAPVISPVLK